MHRQYTWVDLPDNPERVNPPDEDDYVPYEPDEDYEYDKYVEEQLREENNDRDDG